MKSNNINKKLFFIIMSVLTFTNFSCKGDLFKTLLTGGREIVRIEVTPVNMQIAAGTSMQFHATAIYANNENGDVTATAVWDSDSPLIAEVSGNGLVVSGMVPGNTGTVIISATVDDVTGSVSLEVITKILMSIAVTPTNPSKAKGTTQQFTATGTYSDTTTQDLTQSVTWSSANDLIATVSNAAGSQGLGTAVNTGGPIVITATLVSDGISGTTNFTVTDATLVSIAVTPTNSSKAKGTTQQFTATGTYSDTTTQDLTGSVTWSSADTGIATVSNTAGSYGLGTAVNTGGPIVITATSGIISGTTNFTVTAATLVSIAVTPTDPSKAKGTTQQFTATGTYTDTTTQNLTDSVTWSSADTGIAIVSNAAGSHGLGTAVNTGGPIVITATLGSISGTTNFTVTAATLVSIAVTPTNSSKAKGTTQQFTATGTYTDTTTQNLTDSVTWSSSLPGIATISNAAGSHGLATAVNTGGPSVITATLSGISGTTNFTVTAATLVSIAVTPTNSIKAKGTTQQFTATGTYTDTTTQDLTESVTWSSADIGIATVSNAAGSHGLGTAVNTGGPIVITATLSSISGTTNFTVTAATLVSIAVTPANSSKAKGTTQQFTATGTYTDTTTQNLTDSVTWSSADTDIAIVSNAAGSHGLGTAVNTGGPIVITATSGIISGTTNFTVTAATLVSIAVTPTDPSKAKGTTQQFTATGTYTDTTTQNLTDSVTWSSADTGIAIVSNAAGSHGLGTAVNTGGPIVITATSGIISGTTNFTVTAATLVSIAVTPASASMTFPRTQQYAATGTYTDSSNQDLTTSVTWSSSDGTKASISNAAGSKGIVSSIAAGSTTITATLGSISGNTPLTVTPATLVSITVSPVNPSLATGMNLQFHATGIYSDESTQDVTESVTWASGTPSKATISNAAGSKGLATGVSAGTTIISAIGSVTGSTTLTVTPATIIAVAVTPANPSVANGTTRQFTATATLSDSSTQDITTQVTWTSSDVAKATISNAVGSMGLATTLSTGNTTIKATHSASGLFGNTTLTVTNASLVSITITPNNPICYGTTQQFTATGNYSDLSTQNITTSVNWTSSNEGVATISNASGSNGLATSVSVGTTNITATLGAVSKSTSLEVRLITLVSLTISPQDPSVNLPGTLQFTVAGTYSDTTVQDLTTQVLWTSSDTGTAVISNAAGSKGLASTVAGGTTTISASRDGVTGTTTLSAVADTTSPVITAATLLPGQKIQITYSEPVNTTQAAVASNYKITAAAAGVCADNSNFTGSAQTGDFSISSVTVVSPTDYILNLAGGMLNVSYTVLADKTEIRDLASSPNYLGCPNNMDFWGVDTTSPAVSSATSLDPLTVRVSFSENVNASEAINNANYKIVNAPASGACSDNTNFTGSSQTADFNIASVSGTGKVYDITLSSSQVSGRSYTLLVNKSGIHDFASTPNTLGCPNNGDFTGLEQLKVSSAVSVTTTSFIVTFSKAVKTGINTSGSAGCTGETECSKRYFLTPSSLSPVTSATILDGSVCNGAAADPTKVCVVHTYEQGGGQYTVTVANNVDGDGFNNSGWGSIRDSGNTENVQLSPKDRASFVGSGTVPQTFDEGVIVADPFADNSSFGYLATFGGKIYIGPNTNGNGADRFNPNGTTPEGLTFEFTRDSTGSSTSSNTAATRDGGIAVPPYVTIGHTGCTQNNANMATGCGPDNNDGRGLFTSGTISGTEYLFITGGRTAGDNDYLYWTTDTDTALNFNYIDLSAAFDASPAISGNRGTESIVVFNNKIFWMIPGDRARRPYVMKINDTTPESVNNTNSVLEELCNMTGFGYASATNPNKADIVGGTMFGFTKNGTSRLYMGNSGSISNSSANCGLGHAYAAGTCEQTGGVIRSNNTDPAKCTGADACADWTNITPSATKYKQFFTNVLTDMADLTPADQPIPGFADFNGNLYMIRNACTTSRWDWTCTTLSCTDDVACPAGSEVPQLWKCTPGANDTCESDEWTLVAENGSTGKTNMNNSNNSKITLVMTNGSRLYIGFDNATEGITIWRTTLGTTDPGTESDFEQIGANGLGDANNLQIFSGVSMQQGSVYYLYLSTGMGGVPVKIYRQQNN